MADGALAGLRILDFTHVLAGPFAARILGDLGADVVKVMTETRAGLTPAHPYHVMWNRNKRVLQLDLSREDGRELCRVLCERADVVIDNFSFGVLDRWGVGYDAVATANPGVIYVGMSGMGAGGPWSSYVTYAPTIHALAGLTYLTGVPGREDIGIGYSYNDHQAGTHATVAVLAALEARRLTERGQRIDLSQFEVGVNFLGPALLDFFANGHAARPTGNRLPYDDAAPHNTYPCRGDDRWVAIAVMTDEQWQALRRIMGDPPWARDDRYHSAGGRAANADVLDQHLTAWTRDEDAERIMALCQSAGVPAGVVQTGVDLVDHDPQLRHHAFLFRYAEDHPVLGPIFGDRLPLYFSRTPADTYRRPEMMGESNAAVLGDWLGMSEADVRAAEENGPLR